MKKCAFLLTKYRHSIAVDNLWNINQDVFTRARESRRFVAFKW
jgi:hypothetical protein